MNFVAPIRKFVAIMRISTFVSLSLTAFLWLIVVSCKGEIKEQKFFGKALGTTYHITVQGEGESLSKQDIEALIASLNRSLSTYIPTSLISRINRGETLRADEHFVRVFSRAKEIYKQTGGIFDPTVGILVNAWGFGPGKKIKGIERDPSVVDSLIKFVGFGMVRIDDEGFVRKKYPEIFIDFNSIAKGYVIDRIGEFITSKGYENYLIELGGEVLAKGQNKKSGRPWIVAVDYPVPASENYIAELKLSNQALATSGNYRKYRIDRQTGQKYVHTLNPKTGYAVPSNLLSASVVAPDCTQADAWATACMAAGLKKAKQFIEKNEHLEALLIYSDSSGRLQVWQSNHLPLVQN